MFTWNGQTITANISNGVISAVTSYIHYTAVENCSC